MKESCGKNGTTFNCPLCRTNSFKYQKNIQLNFILDQIEYVCSKCNTRTKGIKNYKEHKKNCENIYKCLICELTFNETSFIEHLNNEAHKKIIIFSFDKSNQNKKWEEKFRGQLNQFHMEKEAKNNYINFLQKYYYLLLSIFNKILYIFING